MERSTGDVVLNRTQRILIGVVVAGALVIAAIGFAGSYAAVRELAEQKGFGAFATVFPIGVDAGIAVLLALDLLLTWLRIPFPMLRQAAWLLTAATIAFNGAAAWPDPVGVGMHGVIPVLFVVTVEAARHAVGRLAAITADRHMEGVRLWRWLLAPLPTFRLWRRMMLWEIRRYDDVIAAEQQRLIYQARLRSRFGRAWRWKAPVEELLPLRIARYGVPLDAMSPSLSQEPDADSTVPEVADRDAASLAYDELPPGGAPVGDVSPIGSTTSEGGGVAVAVGPEPATRAAASGAAASACEAGSEVPSRRDQEAEVAVEGEPGQPAGAPSSTADAEAPEADPPEVPDGSPPDLPILPSREAGSEVPSRRDQEAEVAVEGEPGQPAGAPSSTADAEAPEADPPEVPDGSPPDLPAPTSRDEPAGEGGGEHGGAAPKAVVAIEEATPNRRGPDMSSSVELEAEDVEVHTQAIAALRSNAAAVRYAVGVLESTHTPTIVDWLAAHGREVNRGQAHKIAKEEDVRRRGQRLKVVKEVS
ncbi:DUF2637 domain-containing protein [Streptomyces sp. NBC_01264]|nr:DUF2637 domain-containing protein [Streptomyces sp. NBC_01264]MCX4784086.1 DUF2637 domain-containing protein [Streptomyces sp. NBC_01264]